MALGPAASSPIVAAMPVHVRMPVGAIALAPGGDATCEVAVTNTGPTADRFTFEVLGTASSWTTLDPPVLALPPGTVGRLAVHFHPPRAAHVRAGTTPFGLLTTSDDGTSTSVVEELLVVDRFTELSAELIPRVQQGRTATYRLVLRNGGNSTLHVSVSGRDLGGVLAIGCFPPGLTVFPGKTRSCRVRVRPSRRRWCGETTPRQFQIVARPEGEDPFLLEGTLLQRPLLPQPLLPRPR